MGAVLFWIAAAGALLWLGNGVLRYGLTRKAGWGALGVAAMSGVCGLTHALLGGAHLTVVLVRALAGQGFEGNEGFAYNFHFYSLVLVGVMLVAPGVALLWQGRGLVRREAQAWRGALRASLVLLCVNLPMIPFQGFAILLSTMAAVSLVGLVLARQHYPSQISASALDNARTRRRCASGAPTAPLGRFSPASHL